MRARLTRINTTTLNHELRTDSVEGTLMMLPKIGAPVVVFGKPLTEGASTRIVQTSLVERITVDAEDDRKMLVGTENSVYQLEILPEAMEN